MAAPPGVVIDVGSGWTKMGFASNLEPHIVIPTCVANSARNTMGGVHTSSQQGTAGMANANFYIGTEAYDRKDSPDYLLSYPVRGGRVENWDDMERFLQQAIFRSLRCVPEDHSFLLTETPFNTPENRENMAEIMFETFNVSSLHIAVQAVLALYAQWVNKDDHTDATPDLTGLVLDSGDGVTCAIPVADGFVVGSCIQEIPLGGRHVTQYFCDALTQRGEPVPPEQRMECARLAKENHGYVCKTIQEERSKFDKDPSRTKTFTGNHFKNKEPWEVSISHERFMGPEIFFTPEIIKSPAVPLPQVVDKCIMNCPIDYRRRLYSNIVLAGGTTCFQNYQSRLKRGVQEIVDARLQQAEAHTGTRPKDLPVQVFDHRKSQRYAAWLGGAFVASEPRFAPLFKTKKEYEEEGPACMRASAVLM
mmetsp:Transcript_59017/g.129571  ORF Transcript_59017/g.129571 Transcript_59017/m.129571 type:complete len:420 (+) Transcript_59017:81-1340(+)